MKNWFLISGIALVCIMEGCSKAEETGQRVNPQDIVFIRQAALSNSAEIVLGQLAADSSTTPAIQAFGQQMVAEHGSAQASLKTLGSQLGVAVSDSIDQVHTMLRTQLLTMKGRSFDSLYIHTQAKDHRTTVSLFQNTHGLGNNTAVKVYIQTVLPHVEDHLQVAESLAATY